MRRVTQYHLLPVLVLATGMAAPAGAQTLQDALAQAYNNNTTLLAARAQLRAVDEGVPQALSGWRPTVVMNGSVGAADQRTRSQLQAFNADGSFYYRDPVATINGVTRPIPGTIRQERTPAAASVTLTQPIFRGGRTVASVRQAENRVLAQRARLYQTEQQVMQDVTTAYVQVIRFQEEVRLNINNEQVLARQLQATNERFRVGEITRTDVAQAESRLAGARASRAAAEGQLQSARATYQRLVNEAPQRLVAPQPLRVSVRNRDEVQRLATQNNPAVVAALFDEAAARDNIDIQMSTLMPQVSVTTQAFRNDNTASPHTRVTGGQVTANLSVPIFQGGSEHSLVRQARQTAQQNRALVEDARRVAAQQAISAWETLGSTRAQVESVRSQIRAAEIALDGVQREAIVGSRTTLDVLNAEQELLNARVSLVRALSDNITGSYTVTASIGRLTAQDLGLPVETYNMQTYYNAVRNLWVGWGDYAPASAQR
ncbi:TolC family outer membrane protein [Rhodovarius lipocyclicus]|uniref:TolC family outer membrane protein n=1 Tax=Rhodovarius lipocyclicus TaxID=268410 RepID=UPI0013571225|nr:TolC family outer membrane protein [Rhodovarius lipocyclicus]